MSNQESISPYALAVYFRQFAALIGAGVSLIRTMDTIGKATAAGALRQANEAMMAEIEAGSTLSAGMLKRPHLFSRIAASMVRAGEVGGVLDETLDRLARYMENDLDLRERLYLYYELARLRSAEAGAEVEARVHQALDDTRDRVTEALFWRAFGEMLGAGVPLVQALECGGEVFEAGPAAAVARVARGLLEHKPLTSELGRTGLFSPAPLQLCAIGEEVGALDLLAQKAGELLELQTLATLREALGGTPADAPT